MQQVVCRLAKIRKRRCDLLKRRTVAALGGKVGRGGLNRQAELVAALNVSDRLDRRVDQLRRR